MKKEDIIYLTVGSLFVIAIIVTIYNSFNMDIPKTTHKTTQKVEKEIVVKKDTRDKVNNPLTDDIDDKLLSEMLPEDEKVDVKDVKVDDLKDTKDNQGKEVVYKNTPENKGYNMELKVPKKWSKYDYSRLGNPPEVELPKEEYLPGDKLYPKDHPKYLSEGKWYFSADAEKISLESFKDRKAIELILRELPDDLKDGFKEFYSDINNVIVIDEKTGRKHERDITDTKFVDNTMASEYLCSVDVPCGDYSKKNTLASRVYTEEEYKIVKKFLVDDNVKFLEAAKHKNKALWQVQYGGKEYKEKKKD